MPVSKARKSNQASYPALTRTEFQVLNLLVKQPATLWQLLNTVDGTIRNLYSTCKTLVDRGWIVCRDGKMHLHQVPSDVKKLLGHSFKEHFARFQKFVKSAPPPTTEFFQERMLPRDLFRRIEFMYKRGDFAGRHILIVGDDDLFSLAAAITGLPARIVVGEIDERLVNFIADCAQKHKLPVEVFQYNVAEPLPKHLHRQFDVFVMDPVETPKGFAAWLSRAIISLRHPGAIYYGLTELECPPKSWHYFQKLMTEAGLVLTDIIRDHTRYENESLPDFEALSRTKLLRMWPFEVKRGPVCNWYRSLFCRAITLKTPKPPFRGKIKLDRSFYACPDVMTLD